MTSTSDPFSATQLAGYAAVIVSLSSVAFVLTRSLTGNLCPCFTLPGVPYLRGQFHCKLPELFAFFQAVEEALGNARQAGLRSGERPGQNGAPGFARRHSPRAAPPIRSREGSGRPGSRLPEADGRPTRRSAAWPVAANNVSS